MKYSLLNRDLIGMKLDLLDEYTNPAPFPKDEFDELDIPSDQAYIMFSSSKTGTYSMIIVMKVF